MQSAIIATVNNESVLLDVSPQRQKLSNARNVFLSDPIHGSDLPALVNAYSSWVDEPTYLHLQNAESGSHVFVKASKRGNDAYSSRVSSRLGDRTAFLDLPIFYESIVKRNKSRALFVTLTVNPSITLNSRAVAWKELSYYYNKFCSAVRKKFGKVWILRSFESTLNGYPHIHALLIFRDQRFTSFWHKKSNSYRIKEFKEIRNCWKFGFSDVQAIGVNGKEGVDTIRNYIFKDMFKQHFHKKKTDLDLIYDQAVLSLAMNWLFRKQAFAVSSSDLFPVLHNSNCAVEVFPPGEWIYLGVKVLSFVNQDNPYFFEVSDEVFDKFRR